MDETQTAQQLPQPYTTEEIERRPYAVVISLLIGLLLLSVAWATWNDRQYKADIKDLTNQRDKEKEARIEMYETMLFYKEEKERIEGQQFTKDSIIKQQTQPLIKKIFNRNR